jgi:signal peptide peptidase SppA
MAVPELREDTKPVMFGHFAEFETWTEVNSIIEGHFMERTASTAFAKTIRENRQNMRVLFHHGRDALGVQVLGKIEQLEEDTYYEVELFDGVPPLIMDGLRAGEYGSSYRFAIVQHEFVARPKRSAHNPDGLPELTIVEARVREFGPTPFPQYAGTSSGVRSMTDEIFVDKLAQNPDRLEEMLQQRSGISLNGVERPVRPEREYKRSVELVGGAVWAMHPDALATVVGIIGERASGYQPTAEEIRDRIGTRDAADPPAGGSVAVLPLHGMIVPRADLMSEVSGAASIESFQASFREALNDPAVSAILIDIDSPGGDARMVPELASEIRAARGVKPIVAQANSMAASGAYWIATAADEIVVTPSGEVGSIGVYNAHQDISGLQAKMGVKTTLVSAGEYKVERNPFEPLSEDAHAEMKARVDTIYESFVSAVADGRGVDTDKVLNDFGKGRMLLAAQAVKAGMADSVGTFDETLARLQVGAADATRSEPEPSEATTPEPEPSEATTRSSTGLFWFVDDPMLKGAT